MQPYQEINWDQVLEECNVIKGVDQTIFTFDIETSSGYIDPKIDHVIGFDYSKHPKYYKQCEKVALCYEWQLGIGDRYYYGRELRDFMPVLNMIMKLPGKHYIWVHNLGFELSFLLNLFHPEKIFARSAHSPIYFEYENLVFRCSFMYANLSLRSWAKQLGGPKKLEDYDYDKIRTPYDPLTQEELDYGERDCEIVNFGIKKALERYGTMQEIPLTSTSSIRKSVLKIFEHDAAYNRKMAWLLPQNSTMYARQRMCFSGGNVHANWYFANMLVTKKEYGRIGSVDIASSYPTQAIKGPLPMSKFKKARHPENFIGNPKYCCMVEVEFIGLESKTHIDYIPYSKCYDFQQKEVQVGKKIKLRNDVVLENGRVNASPRLTMTITDIDLQIINECIEIGEIRILQCWYARAGHLDKRYINFILDLYENKTALKGVEGSEDLYQWSKACLNGLYGDFVSALVYDDIELLSDGSWKVNEKNMDDIDERIKYLRWKPWRLKSCFAWGVWITSLARKAHFDIIREIDKENHVLYYDTDSVYYIGDHDAQIEEYNKRVTREMDEVLISMGIDPERARPKDPKGIPRQMGILDKEHTDLQEFKAIRAKCYGYRDEEGELHLTVSGVSKEKGVEELQGDLNKLDRDLIFDYKTCDKKISNYNIDQPMCKWIGCSGKPYISTYKYGLNLQPTRYMVTIPQEFLDVLAALGSLSSKISDYSIDTLNDYASRGGGEDAE